MSNNHLRKLIEFHSTDKSPMSRNDIGNLLIYFSFQTIDLGITTMDNYRDILIMLVQAHPNDIVVFHGDEDSIALPKRLVSSVIFTKDVSKYSIATELDDLI